LCFVDSKSGELDYSSHLSILPDYLEYGENVSFYGKEKEKYELIMEPLELWCENGGDDWVNIKLVDGNRETIESGTIHIAYGFAEATNDGSPGNSYQEEISYSTTDMIVDEIDRIVDEFEEYVRAEVSIVDLIRDTYDLY
jgi:hypothetical protein